MAGISDEGLLQEFVIEGREHLSNIEPDLLALEKEQGNVNQEVVNRIFRAIHSIKGSSGFFGLEAIKNLSHVMESLLMMIRDGKIIPSTEIIDPLFAGMDKLNIMIDDVSTSETVDYQAVHEELSAILAGNTPGAALPPKKAETSAEAGAENNGTSHDISEFHPDDVVLKAAIANGQVIYKIKVNLDTDLEQKNRTPLEFIGLLGSMGMILDQSFDLDAFPGLDNCLESSFGLNLLYGTVLEEDLFLHAADLPKGQISVISPEELLGEGAPKKVVLPAAESKPAKPEANKAKQDDHQDEKEHDVAGGATHARAATEQETIRVRVDLLNQLMNLAGEMVLLRNQLKRNLMDSVSQIDGLQTILQNLDLTTSDLQEHIMQTRMQPIGNLFNKFPRVVRDISRSLGKDVELEIIGKDVELDRSLIEALSDPLTHLIRNSCDHGLETPDVRKANGKIPQGSVTLKAAHEGGQINITIIDDGRGIDTDVLSKKALDKGLITETDLKRMGQKELLNLIFLPGFSTAEKISDVSGRGVGMDVVRTNIEKLGGDISIETEVGMGTSISLRLPLTLAIIPTLLVKVEESRFAVPQINLLPHRKSNRSQAA